MSLGELFGRRFQSSRAPPAHRRSSPSRISRRTTFESISTSLRARRLFLRSPKEARAIGEAHGLRVDSGHGIVAASAPQEHPGGRSSRRAAGQGGHRSVPASATPEPGYRSSASGSPAREQTLGGDARGTGESLPSDRLDGSTLRSYSRLLTDGEQQQYAPVYLRSRVPGVRGEGGGRSR
jgi:hypothetical protein